MPRDAITKVAGAKTPSTTNLPPSERTGGFNGRRVTTDRSRVNPLAAIALFLILKAGQVAAENSSVTNGTNPRHCEYNCETPPKTAIIVGAVAGGVALISLVTFVICVVGKRNGDGRGN